MNPRIENRKTTSHVVRVITTYRIDSENLVELIIIGTRGTVLTVPFFIFH
jgi:hypothetical protein